MCVVHRLLQHFHPVLRLFGCMSAAGGSRRGVLTLHDHVHFIDLAQPSAAQPRGRAADSLSNHSCEASQRGLLVCDRQVDSLSVRRNHLLFGTSIVRSGGCGMCAACIRCRAGGEK
eukprot:gene36029-46813_t